MLNFFFRVLQRASSCLVTKPVDHITHIIVALVEILDVRATKKNFFPILRKNSLTNNMLIVFNNNSNHRKE